MTNERAGEFSDPVVSKFAALKAEMGERGVTPDLLARARAATRKVLAAEARRASTEEER
jgi:hypothetical protein